MEPIPSPERVVQIFNKLGINIVLIDLDDTLIETSEIFYAQEALFFDFIEHTVPGIDLEKLTTVYQTYNREAFDKFSVTEERWTYVIDSLKGGFPETVHELFDQGLIFFNGIYKVEPEIVDGVVNTLNVLTRAGIKFELVTHAVKDWTMFKLEKTGLIHFFPKPNIIPAHSYKNEDEWRKLFEERGIDPRRALVVGDNLEGDIIVPSNLGVENLAWVDKKNGWSIYRTGEIPPGTVVIESVATLLTALKKKATRNGRGGGGGKWMP